MNLGQNVEEPELPTTSHTTMQVFDFLPDWDRRVWPAPHLPEQGGAPLVLLSELPALPFSQGPQPLQQFRTSL